MAQAVGKWKMNKPKGAEDYHPLYRDGTTRARAPAPHRPGADSGRTQNNRYRPRDPNRGPLQDHLASRRAGTGLRRAISRHPVPRVREILRGSTLLRDAGTDGA